MLYIYPAKWGSDDCCVWLKERAEMITELRLTSTGSSVERRMIGRCGRPRC